MKVKFTQSYVASLEATKKAAWHTDEIFPNLRLYVGTSGAKTWYVGFRRNGAAYQNHKIGAANVVTVAEARDMARDFLARLARGEEPDKKPAEKLLLGKFIEETYGPWVVRNRKSGKATVAMLRSSFEHFFKQPIDELKTMEFIKWQTKRQEEGSKASTINRLMTPLKAALNWAVTNELIESNPLSRLKPLQERDSEKKTRYLTPEENKRLFAALDEREARLRAARESHNQWLAERGKELNPPLDEGFADYLKPLVILAMNSGIRKSDLLALKWGNVDFARKIISFIPGKTDSNADGVLHVPMNQTVTDMLNTWRQQSDDTAPEALIFPSQKKKGTVMTGIRRSWEGVLKAAQIENLRWHDLRHDFASQLVIEGVDLNTVRELLGHSDLKMTQRYAHLSPEKKLNAVKALDKKTN